MIALLLFLSSFPVLAADWSSDAEAQLYRDMKNHALHCFAEATRRDRSVSVHFVFFVDIRRPGGRGDH